ATVEDPRQEVGALAVQAPGNAWGIAGRAPADGVLDRVGAGRHVDDQTLGRRGGDRPAEGCAVVGVAVADGAVVEDVRGGDASRLGRRAGTCDGQAGSAERGASHQRFTSLHDLIPWCSYCTAKTVYHRDVRGC